MIFSSLVGLRNLLFDRGLFKSEKPPVPVVSVGNLTMGGTGKTPFVSFLIEYFFSKKKKVGVLSRGYHGQVAGIEKVNFEREKAAEYYGDEPTLLASRYQGLQVWVGRKKVEVAKRAFSEGERDVLIADDAFQHRWLARDLDIVLIDALAEDEEYRFLPFGRAREGLSSLQRADMVIVTRANWVSESRLEEIKRKLNHEKTFLFGYEIGHLEACRGQKSWVKDKAVLLSGIGQPQSFEKMLENHEVEIDRHFAFADHFRYTKDKLDEVFSYCRAQGIKNIITTAKDAVKIETWMDPSLDIWIAQLKLSPIFSSAEESQRFYALLDKVID